MSIRKTRKCRQRIEKCFSLRRKGQDREREREVSSHVDTQDWGIGFEGIEKSPPHPKF